MTPALLILGGLLALALALHRRDDTLRRAVVEYVLVAAFALTLAATPSTYGATATITAGVASGSTALAGVVIDAWHTAFGDPTGTVEPPQARSNARPAPHTTTLRPTAHPGGPPARLVGAQPAGPGVPRPNLLLVAVVALAGLALWAGHVRRREGRIAEQFTLAPDLLRGRGRRGRRAA
jgi:hypothetical protein